MSIRNHTFIVFLFTILNILPAFSQNEIWPVQVSGTMLPPHSLNLKVYGVDRTSDLVFNAQLRDPAQGAIYVKPRVTIEQNGTILNQTDPNLIDEPVLLSQFENKVLDGGFLSKYLSNFAMAGYGGQGQGSIDVPEGFNQICIQMYGIDRDVPVSNKFCVSGNFRLNQPPQITKPYFNEKIAFKENQNLLFSWTPMHIGSGNNPGPVEYDFELVELPLGVMNANDVFESALKIYRTTALTNSLIYTPGEPNLEPNKFYAWRVTARSIMFGSSKLFQNDGKSEVSMFVLYEGEEPDLTFNPAGVDIPRGCSVFETSFRAVIKPENQSSVLVQNQSVKVGYFDMVIDEVSGGIQGYSGTGWIDYPMLRSKIEVEFSNIKVNKDGRVYEADRIVGVVSETAYLSEDQLTKSSIANSVTDSYALNLYKSIDSGKRISNLSQGNFAKNQLPIALDNEQYKNSLVCVTGVIFTPQNAFLTLIGLEKTSSSKNVKVGDLSVSAATAVQATPFGMKNGAHLVPVIVSNTDKVNNVVPTIVRMTSMDDDSRIYCDCNGVENPQTKEELYINKDVLVQTNGQMLQLDLKDNKQSIDTYNGAVNNLPKFNIVGADGYVFQSNGGLLNLDETKQLSNLPAIGSNPSSKLLWLKDNTVMLDKKYSIGSSNNVELKGDLVLGENEIVYGEFQKDNLLSLDKGKLEKWRYSVDEMRMTYEDGSMNTPTISGQVQMPVSSHTFDYSGSFYSSTNRNAVAYAANLPRQLPIEMWKGTLDVDQSSSLALTIKNIGEEHVIYPNASISGDLSIKMDKSTFENSIKGNVVQTLSNIQKVFGIKGDIMDFGLSGISIKDWNLDPYAGSDLKYNASLVDIKEAEFTLAGSKYPVTSAKIVYDNENQERLGLSFTTVAANNLTTFVIWANESNGRFVFDQIEQTDIQLNCDCTSGQAIGAIDFDGIYDRIIRTQFMPHLSERKTTSSATANTDELSDEDNASYQFWKNYLFENTQNDFVLINDTKLTWPMLGIDLEVKKVGDVITMTNELLLTSEMIAKMGFKSEVHIPKHYSLYLASFEIKGWKAKGAQANLVLQLKPTDNSGENVEKLVFNSTPIDATGSAITLVNIQMNLLPPANTSDHILEKYRWVTANTKTRANSHARLDCVDGLSYIKLFGIVSLPKLVEAETKEIVEIPFEAHFQKSENIVFDDFIAICDAYLPSNNKQSWKFHIEDQPQVSFKAGSGYSIYFDHSKISTIPDSFSSENYSKSTLDKSFKGVIFKKMAYELIGFNDENKKPISLSMEDAVFDLSDSDGGFYTSYLGEKVLDRSKGAKVSGWKYGLHDVSFTIERSEYKYDLEFAGVINIPLFKTDPDEIRRVQFDSAWVDFYGGVYVNKSGDESELEASFELDDIEDKVFQSAFIPGVGFLLNEDSSIEMEFDSDDKVWQPKGEFSGEAVLLVNSATGKAFGVPVPDGIDFALASIEFSGLQINHRDAVASKTLIEEYGIKSIDFGDWGMQESVDLDELEEDTDNNDDDKKVEPSQVKNKSTVAKTSTPTRKRSNALVKNDPRRPAKTTRARSNAVRGGEAPRKEKEPLKDTEPEFNGLSFTAECTGIQAEGDNFKLGILLTVSLLGDNKEKKRDDEEVSTTALNAKGELGIEFGQNSQKKWQPYGVNLNCLQLNGSIGPVSFDGGLAILRNPKDDKGKPISPNTQGDGFKAFLSASIEGLGGLNAVGQFGKQTESDGSDYFYGFIDIEAFMNSGIPIPPLTSLNPPLIDLYGGGGGIRINMRSKSDIKDLALKQDSKEPAVNDCNIPDASLLVPGVGLTGEYYPEKGNYGGTFYLILGPWNELDIGPNPQYMVIADPKLTITISTDTATNELQFGKVEVGVDAYVKPESIRERRNNNIADGYASLEFSWEHAYIAGEFGMRMKVDVPGIQEPIFQIPANYDETVQASKYGYVKGLVLLNLKKDNKSFEFKFGGPSVGGYTSASKLKHNTGLFSLGPLSVKAMLYLQAGAAVDGPPPLQELIPELKSLQNVSAHRNEQTNNLVNTDQEGLGVMFGAKLDTKLNSNYGPFSANLNLGVGFDINLRRLEGVNCANNQGGGEIGIKGFYAQGQAYAYAKGKINLDYDLFFTSGKVNIFAVNAFAYMQAMGPNPSYFKGAIQGSYSVLDGLLAGDFNYAMELGAECENLAPPAPLASINIFKNASVANGQKNVSRYDDITISTNVPLQKDYSVTNVDVDGNALGTLQFMADLDGIVVYRRDHIGPDRIVEMRLYDVNTRILADKKSISVSFDRVLEPQKEYRLEYHFKWMTKEGNGNNVAYKPFEKTENGSIIFTTGARPTVIVPGMIEYSAPGDRQRYWHKGYADTEIKFKLKALEDAVHLFPEICSACGNNPGTSDPVDFEYYVLLKEFDENKNESIVKVFPITGYPGIGENAKIFDHVTETIDNKYHISALKERTVPVSKVSFPQLKDFEFKKGKFYELSIVREPNFIIRTMGMNSPIINKIKTDNTYILMKYYFGTSEYNSLNEKLSNIEIAHVKSQIKLRDFNHPSDAYNADRKTVISNLGESKYHSVSDDYYSMTLRDRKNNEGFDKYDLMRIRRNIQLEYKQQYMPEKRISNIYNGYPIQSEFSRFLTSSYNTSGGNYLNKVLASITAENHSYGGSDLSSDGTKWGYNITGADDPSKMMLSDAEIQTRKMTNKGVHSSRYDPYSKDPAFASNVAFDFLIQDYRSRVIINQMYWLSRVSRIIQTQNWYVYYPSLQHWSRQNYPGGEFLSINDNSLNDFSWITQAPPGYSVNDYTYRASEVGYEFSYHGETNISFPLSNQWGELLESKRDKKEPMQQKFMLKPNRERQAMTITATTSPTELNDNNWYIIKYNGSELYAGAKDQRWSKLWALIPPEKDFRYNTSQHGLYSLGGGGHLYIRGLRNLDTRNNDKETIWNFLKGSDNKSLVVTNERYKGDHEIKNKNFPAVLTHGDFRTNNDNKYGQKREKNWNGYINHNIQPRLKNVGHNNLEFLEVGMRAIYPEKWYYIQSNDGTKVKDKAGNDKWRIIKEKTFYKIVSSGGYYLQAQHWDETKVLRSSYREHRIQVESKDYPLDKWDDLNHYYRSVWAVIPVRESDDNWFYIKSARYPSCFLTIQGKEVQLRETAEGDQLKIIEVK